LEYSGKARGGVLMSYILEKSMAETERLTSQSKLEPFSLFKEFSGVDFSAKKNHLDLGCGDGGLCHFLSNRYDSLSSLGVDIDTTRIIMASQKYPNLEFKCVDFLTKEISKKFDLITNRLFAHHFNQNEYFKFILKMKESLTQDGEVFIIDMDGAFLNIGTDNENLVKTIGELHDFFPGDMQIARKIPSLLEKAGFRDIKTDISLEKIEGQIKEFEAVQWRSRFEIAEKFYTSFFGDKEKAQKFFDEYLFEFLKEKTQVFYNKFIISAKV
jgi:SAM-dependent methyltransferase